MTDTPPTDDEDFVDLDAMTEDEEAQFYVDQGVVGDLAMADQLVGNRRGLVEGDVEATDDEVPEPVEGS